ncbi:MAG: LysR family transcriptional regulator [Marivita sp.]|uniref:LysR family transcriptional regulator n=1 Tax=Marivita sp. TaxID=2003365 RepID=UPI0025C279F7|nr:LysR family transcriptional regulator [Marivita sp.]MCI5112303.1 LysR family transcriptional regulator [Marivita sp.]
MNWDDLRYFLAVAREGQMLGAARRRGVSQALLSRHIAALEGAVGARLLDRTTRGCQLTEDGQMLLETADRVEGEVVSGVARVTSRRERIAGTIRIGAPDGFGSAFLAPRLTRFRQQHPELQVQLVPVPRSFSLSEREADIAVMVGRPDRGRLRVRKLTEYTLGLYASKDYLERAGRPRDLAQLRRHTLLGYVEDLIYSPDLNYSADFMRDWRSDVEVSTAIGQFEAVRAGVGIGILHDFMAAGAAEIERLFPETFATRTYWTVWHENMRVARRISAAVEILDQLVRDERRIFLRA